MYSATEWYDFPNSEIYAINADSAYVAAETRPMSAYANKDFIKNN